MESWSQPPVPSLPGDGRQLSLYDTTSGRIRPSPSRTAQHRCTSAGSRRTTPRTLATLPRTSRSTCCSECGSTAGHEVHYVQNVTDIDDPLLERAVATGQDWQELARAETSLFCEDMEALGVLPPREYIGAVESIPLIVDRIDELLASGAAYRVDDDIYFSTCQRPRLRIDRLRTIANECSSCSPSAAAILTVPGKKDPLDPLMWQAERPGEPAWDTRLGHGRPGWHIECTAIALHYLGDRFDVQGGGSDLIFPHHEMGASQAHLLDRQATLRHALRAHRNGRAQWREDVEVEGQPGLRLAPT